MKWVEGDGKYHMTTENGELIQEFYNCETIARRFEGISKEKETKYLLMIIKG